MKKGKEEKNNLEKITEQNKKLREEVSILKEELKKLSYLESMWGDAKNLISVLLKPCESCGSRMLVFNWNSKVLMLTCDNASCRSYRVPAVNLDKNIIEGLGIEISN